MKAKIAPHFGALIAFLTAAYPASILMFGGGYKPVPVILLVLALPFLFGIKSELVTREIKQILMAFSAYFLVVVASLLIYGGNISEADIPSRTILTLPILFLLLRYPPRKEWLLAGIGIGAFTAGMVAVYHIEVLHMSRAYTGSVVKGYMPIQSGNTAMTLGLLSLFAMFYYWGKKQYLLSLMFLAAALSGMAGSILSGSRGGWLFAPIVLFYIIYQFRHLLSKRLFALISVSLLLIGSAVLPEVENRINQAYADVELYTQKDNSGSSLGARFEMWKSAWLSLSEKPVFGQGFPGRDLAEKRYVAEGKVSKVVTHYGRAHNQYLEEASTKGLIGITALILLFAVPLAIFLRYSRLYQKHDSQWIFAQCGVIHVILVASYCLTQNFLNHNSGLMFYTVFTAIFLAGCLYKNPVVATTDSNQNTSSLL
ncbi:O-antigen ligase family protein [Photobacterium sp. GJ3]|uniref:O-antigen ligase family protein n=1 Tax=Photobacterium sp. GJ3 TaxID=2829502 RepID=UPI001B8C194D|nr:O-antigen ligase family protein [Photobacterium sp. GJ3]QUJ67284.1 O-antigen ligase family protein [Photobacterium sp. GJ3]